MKQATLPSERLGSSHRAAGLPHALLIGYSGANAVKIGKAKLFNQGGGYE